MTRAATRGCKVASAFEASLFEVGAEIEYHLVATLETRYGPIRVGLPAEARASVSRTVGV